jgi:dienelactone hydrolase
MLNFLLRSCRERRMSVAIGAVTATLSGLPVSARQHSSMPQGMTHEEHQAQMRKEAEMKRRGAAAMGFDQDAATHHFRLYPDGGAIEVDVKDARSQAERQNVRTHLKAITSEFARGAFDRPFQTHGEVPPGVEVMKARASRIVYRFEETAGGGRVRLTTADAEALEAIHAFLRYQIQEHATDPKPAARLFEYDAAKRLDVRVISAREEGGVVVRDLTYAAYDPRHGRIAAYVVTPAQPGPFAGVLYFHWLGKPRGDRTQFLEEATAMAHRGVVSLLIQGYFPWQEEPKDGVTDRQQVIDQVIDTRRAIDLLLSQPAVDARRVAYVGHDYGAMYGAIVAGVDKRARTYVLMAGMGNFGDWSLKYWKGTAAQGQTAYRAALADVDPLAYIGQAAPAALLFQFSRQDIYIAEPVAREFLDGASEPKTVNWYDVEHHLRIDAADQDRRTWLAHQLGLPANP